MRQDEEYARELLRKYYEILKRVLKVLSRTGETSRVIQLLTKYFTAKELKRMLNITPFNKKEYLGIRNRTLVKALKPDWRAWFY